MGINEMIRRENEARSKYAHQNRGERFDEKGKEHAHSSVCPRCHMERVRCVCNRYAYRNREHTGDQTETQGPGSNSSSSTSNYSNNKETNRRIVNELKNLSKNFLLLGIRTTISINSVRKAYKKQALENHPDKGGDATIFRKIKEAHDKIISHLTDIHTRFKADIRADSA